MINPFQHDRAIKAFPIWVIEDFKRMFPNFSNNLVHNEHIVYQNHKLFEDMAGKVLMLVGGGPSSKKISWKKEKFDYLWTMNQFYKSDLLLDQKVDLAMIMGETNLRDISLITKRDKDNILIGFESHNRWENYSFDNYSNYFCMHTKFYGRIGIGARMKIFAACLGLKKIFFTGFDGPEAIFAGEHAFEPGKTTLPGIFTNKSLKEVCYHHKTEYDCLWEVIKGINPIIEFVNLGGGAIYHEKNE